MRFWDPKNEGDGDQQPMTTRYTLRVDFEGQRLAAKIDIPTEYPSEIAEAHVRAEMAYRLAQAIIQKLEAEGRLHFSAHTTAKRSWF